MITTINTLIKIEHILLIAKEELKFAYSLNEIIKSEFFLSEIGKMTNAYLSTVSAYRRLCGDEQKTIEYDNKLASEKLDIDVTKYIEFIINILPKVKSDEQKSRIQELLLEYTTKTNNEQPN